MPVVSIKWRHSGPVSVSTADLSGAIDSRWNAIHCLGSSSDPAAPTNSVSQMAGVASICEHALLNLTKSSVRRTQSPGLRLRLFHLVLV